MLSQGAALKADTIIVSVSKQINKQLYNENCSNFHFRFSGIETQRITGEVQVCHNSEKRGMSKCSSCEYKVRKWYIQPRRSI